MRVNSMTSLLVACFALIVFATGGCDKPTANTGTTPDAGHEDHDHDHEGHDHDDEHSHAAHGPMGGHIFSLSSPDFQGEWKKYPDNNIIRMYVLDAAGKKPVPVNVDSFIVKHKIGNDGKQFEFAAEDPDESGASAVYKLDDQDLAIAMSTGVDIEIKIGDQTVTGSIEAHEPLDH